MDAAICSSGPNPATPGSTPRWRSSRSKACRRGVSFQVVNRNDDRLAIRLKAAAEAGVGYFDIFAESKVEGRWAATNLITLKVAKAKKLRAEKD